MNPLEILNPYRWLLAGGLVAALVLGFMAWKAHFADTNQEIGAERMRAAIVAETLKAVNTARAEERRRTEEAQKEVLNAHKELDDLRGVYAGSVASGKRLLDQLVAARRSCGARPSAPAASGGAAADPTGDLLADVQRRLVEAEDATVRFADESRIAGLTCERLYQSLTP